MASKARHSQIRRQRRLALETLENRRVLAALPFGAFEQDLGEFMLGSVAVTPVLLESNGQVDLSTENWTPAHIQEVLGNIDQGLDWWVDTLATKSSIHDLSFTIDTTYALTPASTKYEPISRRSNDYALYVSEFLAGTGISQTGNLEVDIRAFNQSQRQKLGTDWSFTMFVVPSVSDTDGQFAAGGSFNRAFAFAGGLFMIVPSTRPASTFTHETGHIFWARDEYPGGSSYFQQRGYYNTPNDNSADNPAPGFVQQPSIMASGTLLDTAYANHVSPPSTLAMLGWQDSDGDGIFDVLDVPHRLSGTGSLDPATNVYHFEGEAHVQTLPNLNTSGLRNDITINRIREIEYRFDQGPWQLHSQPGTAQATLDLRIPVPSTASEIEIRARDSKTTVESNIFHGRLSRADATLVPGINGFAWVDANQNGLRDLGEYGQAGWTVELVDAGGTPLDLRKTIEPDNYPDGVLASGFSPHLTLTTTGSDGDGRIGIFADTGTSTGSKNFRGFSRGSQTFLSTWNSSSRRLQATFATPTSVVEIDAVGATNNAYGRLEAYNSAGQLLGRYTTTALASGQAQTMTIARGAADIAYVIVGGHASTNVKLDNLRFGAKTQQVTGNDGQFAFASLPSGTYNVRMTPSGSFRPLAPNTGIQSATVSANTATQDVDFGFQVSSSLWNNPSNAYDVNNDSLVSALDVLLIVNQINAHGAGDLRGSGIPAPPYVDVSGDNVLSGLDALLVINFLNSGGNANGEGEPPAMARSCQAPQTPQPLVADGEAPRAQAGRPVAATTQPAYGPQLPSPSGTALTPPSAAVPPIERNVDALFGEEDFLEQLQVPPAFPL